MLPCSDSKTNTSVTIFYNPKEKKINILLRNIGLFNYFLIETRKGKRIMIGKEVKQ